jgi:hypothetical protein
MMNLATLLSNDLDEAKGAMMETEARLICTFLGG